MPGTLPQLPSATCTTMRTAVPDVYRVYPPRLSSAAIPARVNPIVPDPPVHRRTVMLETIDKHFHNDKRTQRMKQLDHYRYHNAWSKYYYGSAAEQEQYRSYNRAVLKQQMADKWATERQSLTAKVRESEDAVSRDRQCKIEDAMNFQKKYHYLTKFRDDNKKLMEYSWARKSADKQAIDIYDREQLRYNPINWSSTLK